jgi:menaquinone-dependent protoporphyrinogen IX oxidase
MKGAIIYKGKYGATCQYSTWLGNELGLPVIDLVNAGPEVIAQFDYLLLGASVYIGRMQNKEWLERNQALLQGKKLFHYIVCGTPKSEKQKLEQLIQKNIPGPLLQPSSVWFFPGRIIIKNLSWKDRLMLNMGAKLEKNPEIKKNMVKDTDGVRVKELSSLIKAVMIYTRREKVSLKKFQGAGMASTAK